MILPRAATEHAMSSTSGGSPRSGNATANGLLPSIASFPPHGTMWLMPPIVYARPIISRRDAISANHAAAPKWLLLRTETNAGSPCSAAFRTATSIAHADTTWPMPLPPSTTAVERVSRTIAMRGRGGGRAAAQPLDVDRHPHHAVRLDAAQVGLDQRLRGEPRVRLGHAGREEEIAAERGQRGGGDARVIAIGDCAHGWRYSKNPLV